MYLCRIWLKNRRGAAPTHSCPPRKTPAASEGSDRRPPFWKSEPLVQPLRGLYWDGFDHASVVAQHEDDQTRAMKCDSLRRRTRGTFLSVFSDVLFTAQKQAKVVETIKQEQR